MTDFFTHYSKSSPFKGVVRAFVSVLLTCWLSLAHAQSGSEISQVRVERLDDELLLSAQLAFELTSSVEEALLKGIPIVFIVQAEVTRERWYWYSKTIVFTERNIRIAYQPLTRRWKLNISAGADRSVQPGLSLSQMYDTLPQALAVIKRVFRWKIADVADIDLAQKHRLELRLRLDLGQLPRPFQIGAIGQSDWDISVSNALPLVIELAR